MTNYIPFYTRIWEDRKFRNLSVEAQLLFIFLISNKSITLTGIYEIDLYDTKIARQMGDKFKQNFIEIIESAMIKWDAETETIFVINRFKFIPNKSAKVIQGIICELNIIKHIFKNDFIRIYSDYFGNYKPILKDYVSDDNLLNQEQVKAFIKLGWQKQRLKRFYMDRQYPEQKIDELLLQYYPNLR